MTESSGPQQDQATLPSKYLPAVEFRDLPEPVSLRKLQIGGVRLAVLAVSFLFFGFLSVLLVLDNLGA
jgi:hypothetical protein